jgi:hypothetical protein
MGIIARRPFTVQSSYQGPLDIAGAALGAWGLRALSAAKIGTAIDRIRSSTAAESDFNALSGGFLDTAGIATFLGGNAGTFAKLYDQSGNGRDALQATAGNQQPYFPNAIGSLPSMRGDSADHYYQTAGSVTQAQPFSISAVVRPNLTSGNCFFWGGTALVISCIWRSAVPQLGIAGDITEIAVGLANNTLVSFQALFNGASSFVRINGVSSSTGAVLTGSYSDVVSVAGPIGAAWRGDFHELLFFAGDKSANFAALETNQRTYWGF